MAAGTVRGRDNVPTLVAHHVAGMVVHQRLTLVVGHLSPCSYGRIDLISYCLSKSTVYYYVAVIIRWENGHAGASDEYTLPISYVLLPSIRVYLLVFMYGYCHCVLFL